MKKKLKSDLQEIQEFCQTNGLEIEGIIGGAHPTASIDVEPEVHLSNWKIYEVSSKTWKKRTRHFVGYNTGWGESRVSTPIQVFDLKKKIGKTESGRTYSLIGESTSMSLDTGYVWGIFCEANKIKKIVDVSHEYK